MGQTRGLTRRMALTLAAVAAVNALFVATLASFLAPWLEPVAAAVASVLPLGAASLPAAWLLGVVGPGMLLFALAQIHYTRRYALTAVDAREVGRDEHPDLHARVERLAHQADAPVPRVAVADSPVPNSLAVGTGRDATLVVSDGLLAVLDDAELDAVLAHELAHVTNRDTTVMTLASFLPALTNGEYAPLRDLVGRLGPRRLLAVALVAVGAAAVVAGDVGIGALLAGGVVVLATAYLFGGVILGVLTAPVVVLNRSLSRDREFAADRAAAAITGEPAALVSAIRTLSTDPARPPEADKRSAYQGVRGLCFLPYGFGGDEGESPFRVEVRSHPPAEDRTGRLRDVVAEQ